MKPIITRGLCFSLCLWVVTALAGPYEMGRWETFLHPDPDDPELMVPLLMPVAPIHVGLMKTGKVLVIAGSGGDAGAVGYWAAVWNPVNGSFKQMTVPYDPFCNTIVILADGRVFIIGGTKHIEPAWQGYENTMFFNPDTETFSPGPPMKAPRWYPIGIQLTDNSVLAFSGDRWRDPNTPQLVRDTSVEMYDPLSDRWQVVTPRLNPAPPIYPRCSLLPNSQIFCVMKEGKSWIFSPFTRTWTTLASVPENSVGSYRGTAVPLMLHFSDYSRFSFIATGGGSTKIGRIDFAHGAVPKWRALPRMKYPRVDPNAVLLPDGQVLIVAGSRRTDAPLNPVLESELFNPDTDTTKVVARQAFPRQYHATALLLPDATVASLGSNRILPGSGKFEPHIEIYLPPYLFNPDGTRAPRPVININGVPNHVGYGAGFTIQTPHASQIQRVTLVRPGTPTHAFDPSQRLIEVEIQGASAGNLRVVSPPTPAIAPPGYYMVFILDENGVPSKAKFIHLG